MDETLGITAALLGIIAYRWWRQVVRLERCRLSIEASSAEGLRGESVETEDLLLRAVVEEKRIHGTIEADDRLIAWSIDATAIRLPPDLHVVPSGGAGAAQAQAGAPVPTGDPRFDEEVDLFGPEDLVLAIFDRETRRVVREAVRSAGLRVDAGRLRASHAALVGRLPLAIWYALGTATAESRQLATDDLQKLDDLVRTFRETVIDIATRLSAAAGAIEERLRHNASADSVAGVRARNLACLFGRLDRTATRAVAREALRDPDAAVSLLAATTLGSEAYGQLRVLALTAPEGVRAEAIRALARTFEPEQVGPVLEAALEDRRAAVVRTAVEEVGRLRYIPAAPRLTLALGRFLCRDASTVVAIAKVIGRLRITEAETALVGLLDPADPAVAIAGIEALAKVGSATAVEPLRGIATSALFERRLRIAARAAIASIQGRLGPASEGGLSIVTDDSPDGALSIVTDHGRLSVASEPRAIRAIRPDPNRSAIGEAGDPGPSTRGNRDD